MSAGGPAGELRGKMRARLVLIAPLALFAALAALFATRLFVVDPTQIPSAMIGRAAPDFALPALEGVARDGRPVPALNAAALRSGRRTVVNVFASWCVPCHQEHPLLMRLAAEPGVVVAGVAYKDDPENARRFLGAKGNPFSLIGVDRSGRSAIDWGVYGVPETFVVDGAGVIIYKTVGPLTEATLAAIAALAKNPPAAAAAPNRQAVAAGL